MLDTVIGLDRAAPVGNVRFHGEEIAPDVAFASSVQAWIGAGLEAAAKNGTGARKREFADALTHRYAGRPLLGFREARPQSQSVDLARRQRREFLEKDDA